MGVRASTLTGRAVVDPRLLHLTKWKERQVDDMLIAHEHDLGGRFALGPRHAAVLLGMTDDEARPIFELMDTDHNDLVDAFELIATIVTLSGLTIRQKIDVLHTNCLWIANVQVVEFACTQSQPVQIQPADVLTYIHTYLNNQTTYIHIDLIAYHMLVAQCTICSVHAIMYGIDVNKWWGM